MLAIRHVHNTAGVVSGSKHMKPKSLFHSQICKAQDIE